MSSKRLQKSDYEIRVIAPSISGNARNKQTKYARAEGRLSALGYRVSFSSSIYKEFHLKTASATDRARDLNEAYADPQVKAVMALNGGWSSNEILPLIDWEIVEKNPKPLIGFSDITALINAIYAKTGQISYLGPNFGTLGSGSLWQYSLDNLDKLLATGGNETLSLVRSKYWQARGQPRRQATKPWKILQAGKAEGVLIGGNLGTFYLLQGTEYQPQFKKPFILAVEDDAESGKYTGREFSRRLESILQLPGARQNIKGLIIGRFEPEARTSLNLVAEIVASKNLSNIPIVANVDFGHTKPMLSLPIGGQVRLSAKSKVNLELIKY